IVAAPAMRVTMLHLFVGYQGACRGQDVEDYRIGFPYGQPDQLVGQAARRALGVVKAAGAVHRTVGGDAVLPRHDVIFLPMPRRGVDGASSLLQRDVVGQDAQRIAVEKRMPEDGMLDGCARES